MDIHYLPYFYSKDRFLTLNKEITNFNLKIKAFSIVETAVYCICYTRHDAHIIDKCMKTKIHIPEVLHSMV